MREAAMMREVKHLPFHDADDINVRRFRRNGHGQRGQGSFAIEAGAPQAGPG